MFYTGDVIRDLLIANAYHLDLQAVCFPSLNVPLLFLP